MQDLLADHTIASVEETTLGGNQWIGDSSRFTWNKSSDAKDSVKLTKVNVNKNKSMKFAVEILPMEVKTFIVKFM